MNEAMENGGIKCPRTPKAMETAVCLANYFLKFPQCQDIFLFGSTARDGIGSDVDLIVTVGLDIFQIFKDEVRMSCCTIDYISSKGDRNRAMLYALFGIERRVREAELFELINGVSAEEFLNKTAEEKAQIVGYKPQLDIFLFPENWEFHLGILQTDFPNKDPDFMENIARDARSYDPHIGIFQ